MLLCSSWLMWAGGAGGGAADLKVRLPRDRCASIIRVVCALQKDETR